MRLRAQIRAEQHVEPAARRPRRAAPVAEISKQSGTGAAKPAAKPRKKGGLPVAAAAKAMKASAAAHSSTGPARPLRTTDARSPGPVAVGVDPSFTYPRIHVSTYPSRLGGPGAKESSHSQSDKAVPVSSWSSRITAHRLQVLVRSE